VKRRRLIQVGALVVGTITLCCGGFYGYGTALPEAHSATMSTTVPAPPAEVFALISDPMRAAEWRSDVTSVSSLGVVDGLPRYLEQGWDPLTIEIRASEAPTRLVSAVVDHPDFGGTWTWQLEPVEGGTEVTVTEDGEIYNPIFRVFMVHVFGETATMEGHLHALERHFGG